jgi:5-methylthioadenosine/S-adenosylhomocysteine deaminase
MPHAVYTSNPEMLARCAALAGELGCGLHIHLAETAAETAQCLASFGKRPIPYCRDLGVLSPRTTVAHAVDVTDDELEILRESGICVAHNPVSNMKLASGAARVPEMLAAGICVGIGTDGAASNNGLNMFTEMKTCALLHKLRYADPTCVPAATVLDMATTGGAKCAGWPETGALVPGAKADLIALDLSAPNLQPLYSAVSPPQGTKLPTPWSAANLYMKTDDTPDLIIRPCCGKWPLSAGGCRKKSRDDPAFWPVETLLC